MDNEKQFVWNGTKVTNTSKFCCFKYVRIGDEIRFTPFDTYSPANHKDLLNEGEQATSAGNIVLIDNDKRGYNKWGYGCNSYSTTLNLGWRQGDDELISKALEREYTEIERY